MKAEAEKNYRKALELDPNLEESAINLSAILVEGGKFDEAAALMKKAIVKNPKSAALHVNLGMALSGKGDVDGANKSFEDAIKLEPNNGIYLVTYAAHLARNGKKDDAIAKLKQAEKISATDAGVLASVALEYKGMKDFKTCLAVLDKAIGVKDLAELRIYRGTCKLGLKDLPGATTEFKDAVTKEPNNPLAHYSLGNALADGGKLPEAITEWEAYLKLAPDGPQAKAAERKIGIAKSKTSKK
jgi:tetratricopeptide (TPR) repeat protein